jgi:hypothetical protein
MLQSLRGAAGGYRPDVSSTSVLSPVRFDGAGGEKRCRRRRALYMTSTLVLALVVGSAVVDNLTGLPLYGVEHRTSSASTGEVALQVRYPRVTRGELDSALTATIHHAGGFQGAVAVEITTQFLDQFTVQRVIPEPASETQSAQAVTLTFDQPSSDVFVVEWDLATRPSGWFSSVVGRVSVETAGLDGTISAGFRTDVRP